MAKVNIDANLFERVMVATVSQGYSSVEEFVAHAIESELVRLGIEDAEKQVADQLRGLGYIE